MNGFYLGCDVSGLSTKEIDRTVEGLFRTGLYAAGYGTLRLGERSETDIPALEVLRARGFALDLTVTDEASAALAGKVHADAATVCGKDRAKAEVLIKTLREAQVRRICLKIQDDADFAWAAGLADVVDIRNIGPEDDYFTVTRHRMDSCRDGDTDKERSLTKARRDALQPGGRYQFGTLPMEYDEERNLAILFMAAVLGTPLVVGPNPDSVTPGVLDALKNRELIMAAKRGVGKVVRYYDPWHMLLGKEKDAQSRWMLIINRCHGDSFTDVTLEDLGWDEPFMATDVRTGRLLAQSVRQYSIYVETSDHPGTPCGNLILAEKA